MKKVRIIIVIIIIINILISICLGINNFYKNNENNGTENVEFSTSSIEINKKILPENYSKFEQLYDDENACEKFYKNLYEYVRYIQKLNDKTKDLNDLEIIKFYQENKTSIENRFFISTADEFLQLVNNCKKAYNSEQINYKTIILYTDTFKSDDKDVECDFKIMLNNGNSLRYRLNITKNESNLKIYFKPMDEE